MNVSLVQVDGKYPNLALMKLAAHHRALADMVYLGYVPEADRVYISVIWPENKAQAIGVSRLMPWADVRYGGSGYDYSITLPDHIEHIKPAYDLWNIDYSMGFTSRGCMRKCSFCIVPLKEGPIRDHAPIWEFMAEDHNKLMLMDNNFLASPKIVENLIELRDMGVKVNFNQGLDIRLVDERIAGLLADVRYSTANFNTGRIHFAFDHPSTEDQVRRGVDLLETAGIPPSHMVFYVLVGWNTTFEDDMRRYEILWKDLGCYPYVMVYNKTTNPDRRLKQFQRWVNTFLHKSVAWEDYKYNKTGGISDEDTGVVQWD